MLEDQAKVTFQYADQKDVEVAAPSQELMERYSVVELADTATEALKLKRQGERDRASQMVNENIIRNRPYTSPRDAVHYQRASERMKSGMTEADRKQTHYDVYNIKRQEEDKDKEKE